MTGSFGGVDRIRWLAALGASAVLALVAAVVLHQWQPTAIGTDMPPSASSSAGSSSPLDPRIAALAAHHPGRVIETIVQFRSGVAVDRARWDVSRFSGRVVGELHIINALAVRLTAERARWLAADPDVRVVSLNATVKTESGPAGPSEARHRHGAVSTEALRSTYDQTLNATGLWQAGFDGDGIGVAVVDTGVDGNLADFQSSAPGQGSRVVETAVTNPDATTATDGYGHGTDVAGIIAGNGDHLAATDPLKGQYIGVAPDANLISIKVSDDKGDATVLDVIYGLQFAIDHRSDYNIRVVNLSLDSQTPQSYTTDPLDAAAEAAWMHGIVVVAAAGNQGDDTDAVSYAPANDPYVITVGAVDENGTASPSDDFVPGWSSQGTTQDGFQKPDLYAPGAHIVSVLAPGSTFATTCLPCRVGADYIQTSGTSMATPMISGLVADVLQAHPYWTPDQVKGALTGTSVASNLSPREVDGMKVVGLGTPAPADTGLTPNLLIDRATGGIDYSRSSWSRSSWSTAPGSLSAGFARSSWSCGCDTSAADPAGTSGGDDSGDGDSVASSRSSWSRSSWSTHFDPTSVNG